MKRLGKVLNRFFFTIGLMVTAVFLYAVFSPSFNDSAAAEKHFNQKLKSFISSDESSIPLKELTDFNWDKVCHLRLGDPDHSYISEGQISIALGAAYSGRVPDEVCDTFSFNALVFSYSEFKHHLINIKYCGINNKDGRPENQCFDQNAALVFNYKDQFDYKHYYISSENNENMPLSEVLTE